MSAKQPTQTLRREGPHARVDRASLRWPCHSLILMHPPPRAMRDRTPAWVERAGLKWPGVAFAHMHSCRAIYTYKMSSAQLDHALREAIADGPDGGWTIQKDERKGYSGKLVVQKPGKENLKVTMEDFSEAGMCSLKIFTMQLSIP